MLRKTLRERIARRAESGITNAAEAGLATVLNAAARLLRRRDGIAIVATVSLVAGCGSSSNPSPPGPVVEAPAMQQDGGRDGGSGSDSGHVIIEAPAMQDSGGVDSGSVVVEAPAMQDSGSANG